MKNNDVMKAVKSAIIRAHKVSTSLAMDMSGGDLSAECTPEQQLEMVLVGLYVSAVTAKGSGLPKDMIDSLMASVWGHVNQKTEELDDPAKKAEAIKHLIKTDPEAAAEMGLINKGEYDEETGTKSADVINLFDFKFNSDKDAH